VAFELGHDRRDISDADLLADLTRVASSRSESVLKQRTYRDLGRFGVTTVIRRFGSWNAAVTAAGLDRTVERNISDEELFSALYELWVGLGRQPSYSEVQRPTCKFHVSTFERRFGSWRRALEVFVEYANAVDPDALASTSPDSVTTRRSGRSVNLRLRFEVLRRDGYRCLACGASPATTPGVELQVDHVVPWSKGGESELSNLRTLCSACNQGKSNS
jgi:hypothetical protein